MASGPQASNSTPPASRPQRPLWEDRWLIGVFRRLGHAAVDALDEQMPTAWEGLAKAGVSPEQLVETVCAMGHATPIDLAEASPQPALLDRALALRYGVVPLAIKDGALEVATANPLRDNLEQDLAFASGYRIRVRVASPVEIRRTLAQVYQGAERAANRASGTTPGVDWVVPERMTRSSTALGRGDAVEALDQVVAEALDLEASDIHLEPRGDGLLVRFRLDGVLRDSRTIPGSVAVPILSRLKIMGGLNIADRLRPQDGSTSVVFNGEPVDLRISTLPLGQAGEKAVVRILRGGITRENLVDLGFQPAERTRLERLLRSPEGMVLVTGPTGSGKTTTLYSALRFLKSEGTNIVALEDPIEYRLEGINQVEVDERSGLTFAAALRSVLRQDPDVVLVGEIRDAETADIAIKASMTGHLVLSTLHTNEAAAAVARLLDIGADRVALGGALKGVAAQRLLRTVCTECSRPATLSDLAADQQALLTGRDCTKLRQAVGCPKCRDTGYRGRTVVTEIMVVNEELRRTIARGAQVPEIAELAQAAGMKTLWQSGLDAVLRGVTTVHELVDNVAAPLTTEVASESQAAIDAILAGLAPARRPGTAAPTSPVAAASHGRPRVLIVDEDRAARQALRAALERQGWGALEAADGEAARIYAVQLRPDAIVTEIALPRLDGIGLVQSLGADSGPVAIIYTAQTDPALLEWARSTGAAAVIVKPDDVVGVLRTLLEARKAAQR